MSPLRILITSVGSGVGQNLLDSLECRREAVSIVGVDADAENPRLFRCDRVYLVPLVDEREAFQQRLLEIIEAEKPDLVLTGRDHDGQEIGGICVRHPTIWPVFPYGSPEMSHMMQDKWESWEFAQENGLPFAETILAGTPNAVEKCLDMAERHGFPLVAKPRLGYSSLGVRLLFTADAIRNAAESAGDIIQVFLDHWKDWREFTVDPSSGVPLFRTCPDIRQHSCQAIIGPDKDFTSLFCTQNTMVNGLSHHVEISRDPELQDVAIQYTRAVVDEGWRGPFNLQCRRLPDGRFAAFEMNGRLTGATSARAWLGFDEIGLLVERFVGPGRLPPHPQVHDGTVVRFPVSYALERSAVRHLREHRQWSAD